MITIVFKILPFPSASPVLLLVLLRLWILKASYNISGSLNIAHDGWQPNIHKISFRVCVIYSVGDTLDNRTTCDSSLYEVWYPSSLYFSSYNASDQENRSLNLALPPSITATSFTHLNSHYVATLQGKDYLPFFFFT